MRKVVLPALVLLLCVSILSLVVFKLFHRPPPGITAENFRRLRAGMTEKQVEAILGSPGERWFFNMTFGRRYSGEECQVTIELTVESEDGEVTAASGDFMAQDGTVLELRAKPPTLLDVIRSWMEM